MKYFLISLFALLLVLSSKAAQSAEILFKPDINTGCTIHFSGLIGDGDAEKLKKIYSDNITSNSSIENPLFGQVGARICLNSPGGSLIEAFKIFEYLTNGTQNAMTYVPEGSRCESACAIIFLAGGSGSYGSQPARAIHPTARLGFHAPDLVVSDGVYNEAQVSKAYAIALETISGLLKLRRTALADRTMLPSSVLEKMLQTPANEMYYVESVGQAAQWGISIFPVKHPEVFGELNWLSGCVNSMSMINDDPPYFDPMETDWASIRSNPEYEGAIPKLPEVGPPYIFQMGEGSECHINLFNPTELTFSEVSVNQEVKSVTVHYPEYLFYSPSTKIANLPTTTEILNEKFSERFSYLRSSGAKECGFYNSVSRIIGVQSFTNLRREAGLNGRVVVQIPLGATVQILNPGRYLRYDRCAAACDGANPNAIMQCIDNNDVWIEVQYNGRTGFVSRKFLE